MSGKFKLVVFIIVCSLSAAQAQDMPWDSGPVRVYPENPHYLAHENGVPFVWLGDTAWELFHRPTTSQVITFLDNRNAKQFTLIQCVLLAEMGGVTEPTPEGYLPFVNRNPDTPDIKPGDDNDYWDRADWIIDQAASRGLYMGVLPSWWKYWKNGSEQIFNPTNAYNYGRFVGTRFGNRPNILWIMGGDRYPEPGTERDNILQMVAGLEQGVADVGGSSPMLTFHPPGVLGGNSSSSMFHNEPWLDFNMIQTGHFARHQDNYSKVYSDYQLSPTKPVWNGEPQYEDHPIYWNPANGYFNDDDAREAAYWSLFAGAFGHTYGHHAIWQWRGDWQTAMDFEGAFDMQHAISLLLSRPFLNRLPDQSIIASGIVDGENHLQATRGEDYLFVYTGNGRTFDVNMGRIGGSQVDAWWFNPRDGSTQLIGTYTNTGTRSFDPPGGQSFGNDWVLVLDNTSRSDFPDPGQDVWYGNSPIVIPPPSDLTASLLPPNCIEICWTDNSSGSQEEDNFIVQRKPYHGIDEWHTVATLDNNTTCYTDCDSIHGMMQYTYRVGAVKY